MYWLLAYIIFLFSPLYDNGGEYSGFVLIFSMFTLTLYVFYLGYRKKITLLQITESPRNQKNIFYVSGYMALVGSGLLLVDRLASGLNPLQIFSGLADRDDISTTLLSTLGSILRLGYLVFISYFMWFNLNNIRYSKIINYVMFLTVIIDLLISIGNANRSGFYYYICTLFFYLFICKKISLKVILNKRTLILIFSVFLIFSIYTVFVQEKRTGEDFLSAQSYKMPDTSLSILNELDRVTIGNLFVLQGYWVGSFPLSNSVVKNSDLLYMDFLTPLGLHIKLNLLKITPNITFDALDRLNIWSTESDLGDSTWSGIFNVSIACFGILGGVIFLAYIFYIYGIIAKKMTLINTPINYCAAFTFFIAFSRTFDWLIHDLTIVGSLLFISVYYIIGKKFNK